MENIQNEDGDKIVNATEEEVREQIIEKHELNEDDQTDLIDSLTQAKLEDNKKLSTAITQKIKHRDKVEELEGKTDPKTPKQPDGQPEGTKDPKDDKPDMDTMVGTKVNEVLEKRDLDDTDLSDVLKEEVKTFAKVKGVSVKKALDSDYIKFRIGEAKKDDDADDASLGAGHKAKIKEDFSNAKASDFNLMTEEGRKGHAKWIETLKKSMGPKA